jgi:protein-tyrosine phosphatase
MWCDTLEPNLVFAGFQRPCNARLQFIVSILAAKSKMKRVLFLCSGNYYRSRYAEIFFNWHAKRRGLGWQAESRGLAIDPCNIGPISRYTKSKTIELGMWLEEYGRDPLRAADEDFATADVVVAVKEAEHRPLMEASFPQWRDMVEYWQVHDLDCAGPDDAIPCLEREILGLIERLAASMNGCEHSARVQ